MEISSLNIWYTGQVTQSNASFGVSLQLRHFQCQKLLRTVTPVDSPWNVVLCSLLSSTLFKNSGSWLFTSTDRDPWRIIQSLSSIQKLTRELDRTSDSKLRRRCWDKSFVEHREQHFAIISTATIRVDALTKTLIHYDTACDDECEPLCLRDFRLQHRCEDNIVVSLRYLSILKMINRSQLNRSFKASSESKSGSCTHWDDPRSSATVLLLDTKRYWCTVSHHWFMCSWLKRIRLRCFFLPSLGHCRSAWFNLHGKTYDFTACNLSSLVDFYFWTRHVVLSSRGGWFAALNIDASGYVT